MPTVEELKQFAREADSIGDYEAASKAFDMIEKQLSDGAQKSPTKTLQEQHADKYDPNVGRGEYLWNAAKSGLSDLAGAAGLVTSFMRPGQDRFIPGGLGGQVMRQADQAMNVDREMKPPDVATRYLGNVAEFAGAGLAPSAAIVKSAAKKGLALAGETAATVTGGLGAELGGDIAESAGVNRAWGEIPAGITSASLGYGLPGAVSKIGNAKNIASDFVSNKASKEISDIVKSEGLDSRIAESLKISKHIEDVTGVPFKPTLAGRTQSNYLGAIENEALGSSIQSAERAITQMKENVGSLQKFKDIAFPSSPSQLKQEAFKKLSKARSTIEDSAAKLAAENADIASGVTGKSQQSVGESLDAMLSRNKTHSKAILDNRIEDIYSLAKTKGVNESIDDIADAVMRIGGGEKTIYQNMPPVFGKILERNKQLLETGGKSSFEEIHSLYKEVNRELGEAMTARTPSVHYLGELKDALYSKLKKFESEKYGELGKAFRNWNADYKKYTETFYEGAGGRILASGKYGDIVRSESVVAKFFTPSGIDDFTRIYGNDPVAKQLLHDGILRKFADATDITTTGVLNPQRVNAFMKRNAETLDKLPAMRDKLSDASKATEAILERNARLITAREQLEKGIVAQLSNTDNHIPVVMKALTDRKTMAELMNTGKEGRKAVLNEIARAVPVAAQKEGVTVAEFLSKNQATIKPALDRVGKDHYKNLLTIAGAMDMLAAGKPPIHPSLTKYNVDPIREWTGTSGPSLLSQLRASAMYGFISPTHVASSLGARFWMKLGGEKANKLREYILTNPEAAKDFAAATKTQKSTYLSNKLHAHLISAGIRSGVAATDSILGMEEQYQ